MSAAGAAGGKAPSAQAAAETVLADHDLLLLLQHLSREQDALQAADAKLQGQEHKGPAAAKHALGPEAVLSKLKAGAVFLKHATTRLGQHVRHYRLVWVSDDMKDIMWGNLEERANPHGSFKVVQLQRVEMGQQSSYFMELNQKKTQCDLSRCLSLRGTQRDLHLEALSQTERDTWVLAFRFLMSYDQFKLDEKRRQMEAAQQRSAAAGAPARTATGAAGEIESNECGISDDKREERGEMSPVILREEANLLGNNLLEAFEYINALEDVVRPSRPALFGRLKKLRPKLYKKHVMSVDKKPETEAQEHASGADDVDQGVARTVAGVDPDQVAAMEERLKDLETELDLMRVRDRLRAVGNKQAFVKVAASISSVIVPVKMLPSASPEAENGAEEESGEEEEKQKEREKKVDKQPLVPGKAAGRMASPRSDDHEDEDEEDAGSEDEYASDEMGASGDDEGQGVAAPVEMREWANRQARRIKEYLLMSNSITLNSRRIAFLKRTRSQQRESVRKALAELVSEVLKTAFPPVSRSQARNMLLEVLSSVSVTQARGDTYAAATWILGHDKVIVVRDEKALPHLEFIVDRSGLELSSKHFYKLVDADAPLRGQVTEADEWLRATATIRKKLAYTGDILVEPEIILSFGGAAGDIREIARRFKEQKALEAEQRERERLEYAQMTPEQRLQRDRETQLQAIQWITGQMKQMKPGEYAEGWFMIDAQWLDSWKNFVSNANAPKPGPIDNSRLLVEDGSGQKVPRLGLKKAKDFRALHKPVWQEFWKLYGGGPTIFRWEPDIYSAKGFERHKP